MQKPTHLRHALGVLCSALMLVVSLTGCTTDVGAGPGAAVTPGQSSAESPPDQMGGEAIPGQLSTDATAGQVPPADQALSPSPRAIEIAWNKLPGAMRHIGIGGVGEHQAIWALGGESLFGGFEINLWNGGSWDVLEDGAAVAIDVGPSGYPWIVTRENRIYEWTGADWAERPGQARDIGIGADGSVWTVGTNPVPGGYGIQRWTETGWEDVPGGAVAIDVYARGDPDGQLQGEPWIVDADNHISRWTGSEWSRQPGVAQDIGVGANGAVWIIGTTPMIGGYNIATWNGEGWASAPGGGVRISVNTDGFPFVVTDDQQLFQGT